ncbi:hypothetical protein BD413DRAFT_502799 [Trametes elegans]|nr:hypothetical protein BD413DRAFT_502799 [Trametes elegans]
MTTTMADAFDAPMTDSGDIDVSMYPGGVVTTESWLPGEASMGDVAFSTETATFSYIQEGIEIDMLDDDEEAITEYEMADEGQPYDELQDVEVHDASRAPSIPPRIPSSGAAVPHATLPSEPTNTATVADPNPGAITHYPQVSLDADALATTPATHEENATASAAAADAVQDPNTAAFVGNSHIASEGASDDHDLWKQPEHHTDETIHQHTDDAYPAPDEVSAIHVEEAPSFDKVESTHDFPVATSSESAVDTGDPHEISEGVYIDPPPPVLLSLPDSAEPIEYCLFNQPLSGATLNPSGSAEPGLVREQLHLLLHDRPTLYYEPLSAVFAALRLQDCIQNLAGSTEAELVLDAYELKLTVSEDNVHARDVTLHELNVLHDGSELQGPLRLQLKTVKPRFATRYQMLREQLTRLNVTADGEDSHHSVEASEPHPEDLGEHTSQAAEGSLSHEGPDPQNVTRLQGQESTTGLPDDAPEPTNIDYQQDAGASTEHDASKDYTDGAESLDAASQSDARSEEAISSSTAPPVREQSPVHASAELARATEGEERGEEPFSEDREDDGTDNLDVNAVHERTDAGEGGDYVDDEEFPDDEDEFGEDLPEELGRQTSDETYAHTGVAEDGLDESGYALDDYPDAQQEASSVTHGAPWDAHEAGSDVAPSGNVADDPPHDNSYDANTNAFTDPVENSNSTDDTEDAFVEDPDAEGELDTAANETISAEVTNSKDLNEDDAAQESTTLSSEDEDGDDRLIDDWDDDIISAAQPEHTVDQSEALSRKSSTTTLASRTSKRTYDEVELDDFDDETSLLDAATSPDNKRPRKQ